jgi:N-acetylglucosamine-6-phosphate deacetylase
MNDGDVCARHYSSGQPIRILWQNGRITGMVNANRKAPHTLWIAPALIDLQVNGYGGIDFQQDNVSLGHLVTASRRLQAAGCGRFLLTLITEQWPRLIARLEHFRSMRQRSTELRHAIGGWHIEGPFLSSEPGFCGAHDPTLMLEPTPEHLRELRSAAGDDPVLLTLAPERPNALAAIEQAVALGMKVSLGHTNASSEVIAAAIKRGATAFTHLGNGCPRDLDRHDNILWRLFETRGLIVSLIPDTTHVSPPLFRLLHRELGAESIYYITDAMAAAGAKPGRYSLGGMLLEVGKDQIVRLPGKSNFAGSALRPIDAIFRAAGMLGCSWREVWSRYSEKPASLMGFSCGLTVGNRADFCLLNVTPENLLRDLKVFSNGTCHEVR